MMEESSVARQSLMNFLHNVGIELKPTIEINSWDLMKRLVIRGMGVGCIPREFAMHRLADKSMYEITTDPALPVRAVGMALSKNATISHALRAFIDLFDLDV
jgi:DNA-binding transcriptional LysR family regulator